MENTTILISTVITFGFIILLFFLFRAILLWYWKVDIQVDLLTKNNKLLKSILDSLEDSKKESLNEKPIKHNVKEEKEEPLDNKTLELISILKDDEMIIEIKGNKELKIIKKSQYKSDKELHLSSKYNIIYPNT